MSEQFSCNPCRHANHGEAPVYYIADPGLWLLLVDMWAEMNHRPGARRARQES